MQQPRLHVQPQQRPQPRPRCRSAAAAAASSAAAVAPLPPVQQCDCQQRRRQQQRRGSATARVAATSAAAAAVGAAAPAAPSEQQQQQQQRSSSQKRPALVYDFHDVLVPYEQAWGWQHRRVAQLCAAAAAEADSGSGGGGGGGSSGDARDTLLLLQHPPVYTLGTGSTEGHLGFDAAAPPHPLFRTERGGEVTYHGPGQLVLYPIVDLARAGRQDLHEYLRALEEIVIKTLAAAGEPPLRGERVAGLTGVWVGGAKLAAIGVRARRWVTYHGLALNVAPRLEPFALITPCGISDRPVGSVRSALEQQQQQQQQEAAAARAGAGAGGAAVAAAVPPQEPSRQQPSREQLYAPADDPLLRKYRDALLAAAAEVLGLELQPASERERQALLCSYTPPPTPPQPRSAGVVRS